MMLVVTIGSRASKSPSSRRAWIEIDLTTTFSELFSTVALLAEGVDRNNEYNIFEKAFILSPSSRRAWIEIDCIDLDAEKARVALLAEGVDRNERYRQSAVASISRPPRGGRG